MAQLISDHELRPKWQSGELTEGVSRDGLDSKHQNSVTMERSNKYQNVVYCAE